MTEFENLRGKTIRRFPKLEFCYVGTKPADQPPHSPGRMIFTRPLIDWSQLKLTRMARGKESKESPWELKTPPGTSDYTMYREDDILVCKVGSTTLHYQ